MGGWWGAELLDVSGVATGSAGGQVGLVLLQNMGPPEGDGAMWRTHQDHIRWVVWWIGGGLGVFSGGCVHVAKPHRESRENPSTHFRNS